MMNSRADSSISSHGGNRRAVSRASSSVGSLNSNFTYKSDWSSLQKTMTQSERQLMHPLEREDSVSFKFIQFVRLGYLESEASIPIPRNQDLLL